MAPIIEDKTNMQGIRALYVDNRKWRTQPITIIRYKCYEHEFIGTQSCNWKVFSVFMQTIIHAILIRCNTAMLSSPITNTLQIKIAFALGWRWTTTPSQTHLPLETQETLTTHNTFLSKATLWAVHEFNHVEVILILIQPHHFALSASQQQTSNNNYKVHLGQRAPH